MPLLLAGKDLERSMRMKEATWTKRQVDFFNIKILLLLPALRYRIQIYTSTYETKRTKLKQWFVLSFKHPNEYLT